MQRLRTDRVMPTSVVVGGVLFARDKLLRVIQVAVRACANLVDASRLEVNHQAPGDELASSSLRKERIETVILDGGSLGLLTVCIDQRVQDM